MTPPNPMALKSCPFCGWTGVSLCIGNNFWMECQSITCGAMLTGFKTKEEAISAWNTRAPQTGEGVVEALEKVGKYTEHKKDCPLHGSNLGNKYCICGLADVERLLSESIAALNALKGGVE